MLYPFLRKSTLRSFLPSLLLLFICLPLTAQTPRAVVHEDFENPRRRGLARELLRASPHLEVVDGAGVDGGKGLKANYVGSERGSERILLRYPLPRALNEATLTFDVRFDNNFQFVRGGKLLGLGPVNPVTGGGESTPEGWSARMTFRPDGGIKNYIYHQDRPGQWGTGNTAASFQFEKDRYYSLSFYVKVNDRPNEASGEVRIYIDGELVAEDTEVRLRGQSRRDSLINNFLFSTFHGGHNPIDAPRDEQGNYTTVNAYFDNIAIYNGLKIREKPGACWK